MKLNNKIVLITGSSSGIGEALCEEFHKKGCSVIATARNIASLEKLKAKGIHTEQMNVNKQDDITRVIKTIIEREGRIDILINNAGFALIGPTIELTDSDLRTQFETNVIAPLALAREVAPVMRKNKTGMIVNIGSISGIVSSPFSGAYCASKAALHSLSDTLRMELSPFGIKLVTVQPGAIKSGFGKTASKLASDILKPDSWYISIQDKIISRAEISQNNATPTNKFASRLVKSLLKDNPSSVLRFGKKSFYLPRMKCLVPRSILDSIMNKKFGIASINDC